MDSTDLRNVLSTTIPKFEKNRQCCPIELLENLLEYFHSQIQDCPSHCASHHVFGYNYFEETSCDCQKVIGDQQSDYIIRLYAAELYQLGQNMPGSKLDVLAGLSLASQAHIWPCESCGKISYKKRLLQRKPRVLLVSIIWTEVPGKMLSWLLDSILPVLLLRNLFTLNSDQPEYFSRYIFKGLICFTASHYISFFYSLRRNAWIQFDDCKVRVLESWTQVYAKLVAGKMKPVMLVYELDSEVDKWKREYQLEYIETENINYLLDPDVYFESFGDTLVMDLAGLTWKSELLDAKDAKKCSII